MSWRPWRARPKTMSESTKETPDSSSEPHDADAPAPGAEGGAASTPTPEADAIELSPEEELQAKLAEMEDRWLRGKAELENSRKRQRQDLEEARRFGAVPLLGSLLTVLDTLQRAISEASKEAQEGDALLIGLRLTEQQFLASLGDYGVIPFEVQPGDALDTSRHRALLEQPTTDQEPGTILSVFQAGYLLHDRLLREAQVIVAAAPATESDDDADV